MDKRKVDSRMRNELNCGQVVSKLINDALSIFFIPYAKIIINDHNVINKRIICKRCITVQTSASTVKIFLKYGIILYCLQRVNFDLFEFGCLTCSITAFLINDNGTLQG